VRDSDQSSTPECYTDWPAYVSMEQGAEKDEARRSFVLTLLCDDNGVLLRDWRKEVQDLEHYLRDGSISGQNKQVILERVK